MARLFRTLSILVLAAVAQAGCASLEPAGPQPPPCPDGQVEMRTAQLFFGRNIGNRPGVSEAAFQAFVDEEVTPRFPQGLTVLDGGGQWQGAENRLIREASKVVVLVFPKGEGRMGKVDEVRRAYKHRFHQESVLTITQDACVAF
jgi:hypothetical protein